MLESFLDLIGIKSKRNINSTRKTTLTNEKICVGDHVTIKRLFNNKENCLRGTVRYIGTPLPKHGVRFGIDLNKAKGDHDGTLNGIKYFESRRKHGIFIKKKDIISIERGIFTLLMVCIYIKIINIE